jgi:acetylornithine deacetylase/succinyl-diaminopimelate desuccinylase-like protein
MVAQHFDEIDAEYALTEGGGATLDANGRLVQINIATTEKVPRSVRLLVNGTSGHASIPRTDNALVHLSAAVAKLGAWQTPMRLNDTTRTYFQRLAAISTPEKSARYKGLTSGSRTAAIEQYLAEYEPQHYSMLRTSVVPTILKAGFRVNVIPSEAEATVDVRALPDEDMTEFLAAMRRVIGDPAVKIENANISERPVGPPSRLDTEMYRALEQVSKRMYPGSTTIPTMLNGATDMAQLRAKGVQCYGIGPASTSDDSIKYGAHSDVERLLESSVYGLAEFTWNVVTEVAASR